MVLGESEVGYDGLPELPPNWEYNKPGGVDGPPAPAAAEVPLAAAAPPDSSPDQSVVDARTPQEQQCDGGDGKSGQLLLGLSPPEKLVSDSEDEYDDVHALSCLPCVKSSDEKVHPLWRRRVVIATCNYGMIAMSYILIDETIPLFLQLDKDMGGFSVSTSQVGILYSYTGISKRPSFS